MSTQKNISIHSAASEGNLDLIRSMLIKNPDLVNSIEKFGFTPLHFAAFTGNKDVADLLLTQGADVNAKFYQGITPMQVAVQKGHKEVIDLLIKYGWNE